MNSQLEAALKDLAAKHGGMQAILASCRNLIQAEADEITETGDMDNPADVAMVEKLEALASTVLHAGADYAALEEVVVA